MTEKSMPRIVGRWISGCSVAFETCSMMTLPASNFSPGLGRSVFHLMRDFLNPHRLRLAVSVREEAPQTQRLDRNTVR